MIDIKRKYFSLLLVAFLLFFLTGCGSDNNSVSDYDNNNYDNNQQSCTLGWIENGRCCKAISTGQFVDENGQCPGRSVPGYEVPAAVNNRGCFTIHCN